MSIRKAKDARVRDVMIPLERCPIVGERVILKEALEKMGETRLGIACVVRENGRLEGILTDGDLRRKLLKVQKPISALFVDDTIEHAIREPITTGPDVLLKEAVDLMGEKQVWDLPVVSPDGRLMGLLHLHPAVHYLLREG
jgi:DeoR family transcriptional regulator, catabolite repression regulator